MRFIGCRFVQESITWLLSKGKVEEAEKVIRKVAKFNKKTLPNVLFSKEDIQELQVMLLNQSLNYFGLQ